MILGPMILGVLSGVAAALAWVLTGGSVWVATGFVYTFTATLVLVASAALMALRSPEQAVNFANPKRT